MTNAIVIQHHGKDIDQYNPTTEQRKVVELISQTVDVMLRRWGRASGKTVVRKMIAQAILDGDN